MGLSSNIIWHQTSFDGLKAILKSKMLCYSYSLETINWKSQSIDVAFPMISFCDIPLADLSEYIGKYGNYTIGFKRLWGRENGVSPVWYRDENAETLKIQMDSFKNHMNKDSFKLSANEQQLWQVIANTKNHEGKLLKKKYRKYRFYDEREVRLVPSYKELVFSNIKPFIGKADYEKYKTNFGNSLIPNMYVTFGYDDIVYIIYSNKKDSVTKLIMHEDAKHINLLSHRQIMQDVIGLEHNRKE